MKPNQVKLDIITRSKTLTALLTNNPGGSDPNDSTLVARCKQLHNKPIGQFSVEDLRIMIGQHIGIDYLIPLALEVLEKNILAEGDFYPGDLLQAVLKTNPNYWLQNPDLHNALSKLMRVNAEIINEAKIDTRDFITLP